MSNSPIENWMYNHNWTANNKIIYDGYDMQEAYEWGKFDTQNEQVKALQERCASLENLLAANVRVIRAEIEKELADKKERDNATNEKMAPS
jgi:hypothetical protein